ncbi:hypothetical protein J2X65_000018 [Ancylobacter sp. 3268]|uniref:hypothetical protein n=1 Tax=Ancylobacter sp. 3268 TaxID=2817752 RepID=UPI002866BE55|nr:hypothetical protein [Ancylobacter sp. 3268]MDR6950675.1 hypothetical protein [Ancylobacter sp. 3268]
MAQRQKGPGGRSRLQEELKKFMTDEYDRFRKTQIARMARAGKAQQNKPPN